MRPTLVLPLALLSACSQRAAAQSPSAPPVHASTPAAVVGAAPAVDAARPVAWQTVANGVRVARTLVLGESNSVQAWSVVRLDLEHVRLTARSMPHETIDDAAAMRDALAAVDGGFFDPEHRPSGLLIDAGRLLFPFRAGAGSGVLVVQGGRADVVESAVAPSPSPGIDLATQCGPRLVERDGSAGIYRDDGQRWARTAACVRDGGRTLDLITTWDRDLPLRGPGLLAFSRMLAGPSPVGDAHGCERALNLDGGPSTGVFVRGHPDDSHGAVGPIPWAIVARAR